MKILYIHQYFRAPDEPGSHRSWYIASALMEAGHEVVMVTAHSLPKYVCMHIKGMEVHYLPVPYSNSMGSFRRIRSFFQFVWQALLKTRKMKEVNLCYITSTPLTTGIIGLVIKRRKKIPFIFEVRDLWPEAPVQLGAIRSRMLKSILYELEKRIYRGAEKIIALSPGMVEGVKKKAPDKEVYMVPNMADCLFFSQETGPSENILEKYDLKNAFRIIYTGAIGRANHLESLLALASLFSEDKLNILIIGEGSEKNRLMAQSEGINTITWMDPVDKKSLRELFAVSDAAYISFADIPILETNSPNKFFDALSAGKMIMVNIGGWIKDLVEENKCGFYAEPQKPETVRKELLTYMEDQTRLVSAQQNARLLAEREFDREKLSSRVVEIISGK